MIKKIGNTTKAILLRSLRRFILLFLYCSLLTIFLLVEFHSVRNLAAGDGVNPFPSATVLTTYLNWHGQRHRGCKRGCHGGVGPKRGSVNLRIFEFRPPPGGGSKYYKVKS